MDGIVDIALLSQKIFRSLRGNKNILWVDISFFGISKRLDFEGGRFSNDLGNSFLDTFGACSFFVE
jgi:hypothetical protein